MWLVRAQKDVSLLESVTSAIRNTLGRLVGTGEGPSPDEQVAAAWARVDQKKDQVSFHPLYVFEDLIMQTQHTDIMHHSVAYCSALAQRKAWVSNLQQRIGSSAPEGR